MNFGTVKASCVLEDSDTFRISAVHLHVAQTAVDFLCDLKENIWSPMSNDAKNEFMFNHKISVWTWHMCGEIGQ